MSDLHYLSAIELLEKLKNEEITVEEILINQINHIHAINPKINALVYFDECSLLDQAKEADKKLATSSKVGPLHGLPFSIKDNLEVAGMVTTGGITGRKGYVPTFDALVVKRLKDAGAIILGKTNCPSHCSGYETTNQLYGLTNNPYNLDKTVGSSSGGEAALISSGCSFIGLGSDTGGSIRWPANFTGLASLVPTFGRVPRTGTIPYYLGFLDTTCIGPLARSISDLVYILPLISGPDNWDPNCLPLVYDCPDAIVFTDLKIAYYHENGVVNPDTEVKQVIHKAADSLSDKEEIDLTEIYPDISKEFFRIGQGLNSFASGLDSKSGVVELTQMQKDQ